MRWSQSGAESLLHLRAVAENDDWDAYHAFRREKRHTRLYGSPFSRQPVLENQALDSPTLPIPPSPQCQAIRENHQSNYQNLPLAD
jgi:hypothetical protein